MAAFKCLENKQKGQWCLSIYKEKKISDIVFKNL